MKKKIFLIILLLLLFIAVFIIGRQVGLNTEDSKTKTIIKEETIGTQDIKSTLTSSGQVSAKTTEKIELDTNKYFKAICIEDDDEVKAGEKLIEYTNGTYLTAPYDLVVISHSIPETENKCTSSNYIEVSNLDTLVTTLSINENEINSVAVNQEVEITLTSDENKTYIGKVTKIDSIGTYEASGTTFSTTIEFENDDTIKLGMSLSCTIILQDEKDVISVPINAVYEDNEGNEYVNKVKDDGSTEKVIIETGIANDNYVQVKSGLELNDKVQIITEVTESDTSSDESSEFGGFGGFSGGEMPKSMNFDFSEEKMPNSMPSGMQQGESQGMPRGNN